MRIETIGNATLYLGNCLEVLPVVGAVDAVVTDPPYGIGIARSVSRGRDNKAKATEYPESDWDDVPPSPDTLNQLIAMSKAACFWGGNYFGLPRSRTWLVWDKMLRGQDMADCELAWTNYKGKGVRLMRHLWSGFFRDGDDPRGVHPAQKPQAVMGWSIQQAGEGIQNVFDPFMGSGTTGVASAALGLPFIGVEIEPHYFEIACERIYAAQRQERLFA